MQCFEIMIMRNYVERVKLCKSACNFSYSVLEYGCTRNYYWQNYVGLPGTTGVP